MSLFSPICRIRDYSIYEIVYLNSEINTSGTITHFAFERADGDNVDPIQNVSLYMKHTTNTQMTASTYSDNGYQLVYQGTWPNDVGGGWREVALSTPFSYDGISNLQVLVTKDYEPLLSGNPIAPRWLYTLNASGSDRARRYYGNVAFDSLTNLSTTNYNANARLTIGSVGVKEILSSPFTIFPNPVNAYLNINLQAENVSEEYYFEIHDINGQLFLADHISGRKQILLNDTPGGFYFITVHTDSKTWTEKLIIQ